MRVNKVINILAETFKLKDMERKINYQTEELLSDLIEELQNALLGGSDIEVAWKLEELDYNRTLINIAGKIRSTINEIESN